MIPEYQENLKNQTAEWAAVSHSNASDLSTDKDENPLIELVSADNKILFQRQGAKNGSLYTDIGEVFSSSKQSNYFTNGKFNDGSDMNYSITINEITSEGINITVNVK